MIFIFNRQIYNPCISLALIKGSDKTHILLKSQQDYASLLSVTLVFSWEEQIWIKRQVWYLQ